MKLTFTLASTFTVLLMVFNLPAQNVAPARWTYIKAIYDIDQNGERLSMSYIYDANWRLVCRNIWDADGELWECFYDYNYGPRSATFKTYHALGEENGYYELSYYDDDHLYMKSEKRYTVLPDGDTMKHSGTAEFRYDSLLNKVFLAKWISDDIIWEYRTEADLGTPFEITYKTTTFNSNDPGAVMANEHTEIYHDERRTLMKEMREEGKTLSEYEWDADGILLKWTCMNNEGIPASGLEYEYDPATKTRMRYNLIYLPSGEIVERTLSGRTVFY